jgi:hypothetical protein
MFRLALARVLTAVAVLVPLMVSRPAAAAPLAVTYCNRLFLPMVIGSNDGPPVDLGVFQPANGPCEGSPDFNGDGYADLALGVPRKEVSNGIVTQTDVGIVHVIYGSPNGLDTGAGQAGPDDQVWHRAVGGVAADAGDEYGAALAMGDFNRDGYDDLAIGIPGANIDGQDDAGALQVIYGSPDGLAADSIDEWSRGNDSISGASLADERFGAAITSGDYDGDGYADLAVAAPYATVGGDLDAGAVTILYGGAVGLAALGNELLTQDNPGFPQSPAEADDVFGFALASGDFNGDHVDDLAVGTPNEDNGVSYEDAGSVQIFFGGTGHLASNSGLLKAGLVTAPQHWTTGSDNVEGAMEANELFGYAVAAGDFNGDGYDDLAVGTPRETHGSGPGTIVYGGAVHVFQGGAPGLVASGANPAKIWHQDVTNMDDEVEAQELFGHALAAGDFNNDGYADLAIGVPGEQSYDIATGAIHLMYGSGSGVTASNDELIYDPLNPALSDWFGRTVTVGDFNGDGFMDLAVGAPKDDPSGVGPSDTGSVFTFYSDADGVAQNLSQNIYAGHLGLKGSPATNDYFGNALPGSPLHP